MSVFLSLLLFLVIYWFADQYLLSSLWKHVSYFSIKRRTNNNHLCVVYSLAATGPGAKAGQKKEKKRENDRELNVQNKNEINI
jgi:hypothetical protein